MKKMQAPFGLSLLLKKYILFKKISDLQTVAKNYKEFPTPFTLLLSVVTLHITIAQVWTPETNRAPPHSPIYGSYADLASGFTKALLSHLIAPNVIFPLHLALKPT